MRDAVLRGVGITLDATETKTMFKAHGIGQMAADDDMRQLEEPVEAPVAAEE